MLFWYLLAALHTDETLTLSVPKDQFLNSWHVVQMYSGKSPNKIIGAVDKQMDGSYVILNAGREVYRSKAMPEMMICVVDSETKEEGPWHALLCVHDMDHELGR